MSSAQVTPFGTMPDGREVARITLCSDRLTIHLLTLGANLQGVHLDDGPSLVTGAPDLAPYLDDMRYCGAIVGPVAGRICGAEAMIADQLWRFSPNEGRQLLHGGNAGLHARVWQIADLGPSHATLALDLAHCEDGFPGARRFEARYRVDGLTLALDLVSRTDRPTLANLAPHAYWNLRGEGDLGGHVLRIAADHVLPLGPDLCPLGAPEPVAGRLDLRQGQALGQGGGFDNCFCLAPARRALRPVAWLTCPDAPSLTLATTEPGLQVYDAFRHPERPFFGVAMESQCWPDAPRHPDYPPILLSPEDGARVQQTVWTLRQPKGHGT